MKLALSELKRNMKMMVIYKCIMDFVKANWLENELIDPFKVEYLALLLKFKKELVLKELKARKYPPLECLKLCEQAKHSMAIAYLKDRLGYTKEALDIYKRR